MVNEDKEAWKESRREDDECAVAVVARRRSEGTHPINKTTRVTIKFNREKNGFQSAKEGWGGGARRDPRSKSPSTYAPLLFIVPNFHSQRNLLTICRFIKERKRERGIGQVENKERKTAFANGYTAFGIIFFFITKWTTRIFWEGEEVRERAGWKNSYVRKIGKESVLRKGIDSTNLSEHTEGVKILLRIRRSPADGAWIKEDHWVKDKQGGDKEILGSHGFVNFCIVILNGNVRIE